jgi:hypothetical protein
VSADGLHLRQQHELFLRADGVRASDLDALAAQIDRPFLHAQRRAFA